MDKPRDEPSESEVLQFAIDTADDRLQRFSITPTDPHRPVPKLLTDPQLLDAYARAFYECLMRNHPEWRPLARTLPTDNGFATALFMELPSPSEKIRKLWISTEDGVTVGLGDLYHTHFHTYEPDTDAAAFVNAIRFVDDLLDERLVLVIGKRDGRTGSSWIIAPEKADRVPEWLVSSPHHTFWGAYDGLVLLSWKSTFDREVTL